MRYIDLRSDTVTHPPKEMKEFMFLAELGDDVYDEDYVTKELENLASEMLGKEAALFVPSGTFANQLAIMTHTKRGDEIIVGDNCHILLYEVGGAAALSSVQVRTAKTIKGAIDLDNLKNIIRGVDIHYPDTGLICTENAHSNGSVIELENLIKIKEIAESKNIPVHMDGARFFNAVSYLGVTPSELANTADTINICLSKGLCAPIGSLLVGSKEFIVKAKRNRKLMGGGMRQTGMLAAAGIYALKNMTDRLVIDRENALYLADELLNYKDISIDKSKIMLNMLFIDLSKFDFVNDEFVKYLNKYDIKINGSDDKFYRFVTHYWIGKKEIDIFVEKIVDFIGLEKI